MIQINIIYKLQKKIQIKIELENVFNKYNYVCVCVFILGQQFNTETTIQPNDISAVKQKRKRGENVNMCCMKLMVFSSFQQN